MRTIVLTTGGTIEKIYSEQEGAVVNVAQKIGRYLKQLRLPERDIEVIPVMNKDSLEMTAEDRAELVRKIAEVQCEGCPIVITHGTPRRPARAAGACCRSPPGRRRGPSPASVWASCRRRSTGRSIWWSPGARAASGSSTARPGHSCQRETYCARAVCIEASEGAGCRAFALG